MLKRDYDIGIAFSDSFDLLKSSLYGSLVGARS